MSQNHQTLAAANVPAAAPADVPENVPLTPGLGAASSHIAVRPRRRRWPIVLVVLVVVVLALALAVWEFVVPLFAAPPIRGQITRQATLLGAPDIATQPTWSAAMYFLPSDSVNAIHIVATAAPDIALVSWYNTDDDAHNLGTLTAINLATQTTAWTKDLGTYSVWTNTQDLTIMSGETLMVVDPLTGDVWKQTTLPDGAFVVADAPGIVVTEQDDQLCARSLGQLDACLWNATSTDDAIVFGDDHWIDTGDGVLDLHTGKPAPFGADAGKDGTVYVGPRPTEVFRITKDADSNYLLQRWDTAADKGLGEPVVYQGYLNSVGINSYVVLQQGSDSTDSIQAYSWQTGQSLWPAADVSATFASHVDSAGLALVGPGASGANGCLALSAATGEQIWTDPGCLDVLPGPRTAYAVDGSAPRRPATVTAYDAVASGFPQLWTLDVPEMTTDVAAFANHLVALALNGGSGISKIWVATP